MQDKGKILVVALAGGACLLFGICCGAGILYFAGITPFGRTMTREAFEAAVRGKTRDEVIQAVGRPDRTFPGPVWGDDNGVFEYRNKTINPVARKSEHATVVFDRNGRANVVNFSD